MNKTARSLLCSAALSLLLICGQPGEISAQGREIDLADFLGLVEENSLDLEGARIDRQLAAVQERLTRSRLYPTIAGQAAYNRNLLDLEQELPIGASTEDAGGFYPLITQPMDVISDNEVSLGFSLEQRIFDMSVFRALEASEQFTSLTGTAYEVARQGILTEAKRLFYQTLLLEEVLAVRRSSEEIALENFQETERRFESGIASRLEVLRSEVNWKITQPATTQAERNLQVALQNLKDLAGLPLEEAIVLTGSLESFPELPEIPGIGEIRSSRPDYQVLVNERRLRELNVDAQRAAFYPSLSATATYGLQAESDQFDFGEGNDTLSVGLALNIPLFFGGSRFASMDQARLEVEKVNTQVAQKESEILTEIETLRLTLREAGQRIESAQQTLATAEEAYSVTQSSVDSGLSTQLELKDARVSLESARLSYLSAVFDYLSAYFDFQRATGRGEELPG
ncbi:MAG: TolC family protein [Alkalispirochaetaceae bacterium]